MQTSGDPQRLPAHVLWALSLAIASLGAPGIAYAKLDIPAGWCNQHPQQLQWSSNAPGVMQPYVIRIAGNAGLRPDGTVATLAYFINNESGQGVYLVTRRGEQTQRTLLPPLKMLPVYSADPNVSTAELTIPADVLLSGPPDANSVVGTVEFELGGVVTERVPLVWSTSRWEGVPVTPLPRWDPLAPPQSAHKGPPSRMRMFEFKMRFTGCPPFSIDSLVDWTRTAAAGGGGAPHPLPVKARLDALSTSAPGTLTLQVAEADLYRQSGGQYLSSPDHLYFAVPTTDGGSSQSGRFTYVYFPIRRPLEFTSVARPNRIDLSLRKCWYLIEVDYTGGHPVQQVGAGASEGVHAHDVRWATQRRARGGALLRMEVPASAALEAATHFPPRVWVTISQPVRSAPLRLAIVNVPSPPTAALPPGGCNWNAPSVLPSR